MMPPRRRSIGHHSAETSKPLPISVRNWKFESIPLQRRVRCELLPDPIGDHLPKAIPSPPRSRQCCRAQSFREIRSIGCPQKICWHHCQAHQARRYEALCARYRIANPGGTGRLDCVFAGPSFKVEIS
jgi:hypothetical protein